MLRIILFLSIAFQLAACAKVPYTYLPLPEAPTEFGECRAQQITRGEPNSFIDGLGHYFFSLPSKLILWNWHVENHNISAETETALRKYICENHLDNVKFRLNEYSPGDEWSRLFDNSSVGAGWRYTLGVITVAFYTIFPGRIFGGDHYNPYTNSVNIYSDLPVIALHEAGHAKDFARHVWKGSYAFLGFVPLASLWFEGEASGDAIGYLKDTKNTCYEKSAYKVLYPAYGTYVGGEAVQLIDIFTPVNELFSLAAVIPGHIIGRIKASKVECVEPEPAEDSASQASSEDTNGKEKSPAGEAESK